MSPEDGHGNDVLHVLSNSPAAMAQEAIIEEDVLQNTLARQNVVPPGNRANEA